VELLERLLRDEVKARMKTDVISEKKYSERILESMRKYHNRAIETAQLRQSTTVDWQVRDSVRAKLRNLVRRALRKWKYPPDKADKAIDLCMKQAEALSESWVF
jgi:hypothetical protein